MSTPEDSKAAVAASPDVSALTADVAKTAIKEGTPEPASPAPPAGDAAAAAAAAVDASKDSEAKPAGTTPDDDEDDGMDISALSLPLSLSLSLSPSLFSSFVCAGRSGADRGKQRLPNRASLPVLKSNTNALHSPLYHTYATTTLLNIHRTRHYRPWCWSHP
eukprot:TRINITY_DN2156_c0_g1_i2.p1 TRINITY_DN2156_c0_g1~~TRINITY_DN2156_c0_g1_i2.p1  ORF type:complete len:162 (+),score=40.14 TRINITY_DN2156_c0_g1_i2:137-622(+)